MRRIDVCKAPGSVFVHVHSATRYMHTTNNTAIFTFQSPQAPGRDELEVIIMDHQKSVLWLPNLAVTRHRAVVHAQQVPEMQTVMQSNVIPIVSSILLCTSVFRAHCLACRGDCHLKSNFKICYVTRIQVSNDMQFKRKML